MSNYINCTINDFANCSYDSGIESSNSSISNSTGTNAIIESHTHVVPVTIILLGTELLITYVVWSYGHRRTCPWYLQICATIGWVMPLTVFTLLPLDMASSLYRECVLDDSIVKTCDVPFAYVTTDVLIPLWRTIYWTAQIFSFIITPLLREFFLSGEFTFGKRLKSAFVKHIYYFGTFGILGLLSYIAYGFLFSIWNPKVFLVPLAMALVNAFGLLNIILFLGSGAIELPRKLWNDAYNKRTLRHLQFKAPATREAFVDAEADLHGTANAVYYVSSRVPETSELRPFVDQLVRECPIKAKVQSVTDEKYPEKIDYQYIVQIHARLKSSKLQKDRMYATWRVLLKKVWRFQDIITNRENTDRKFHTTLINRKKLRKFHNQLLTVEWYWYLRIRPYVFRFACVLAAIFSAIIVWSEITLFVTDSDNMPRVSIFRLLLNGRNSASYQAIQFVSVISIAYMIVCAYLSLMQMSIFSSAYALLQDHHTDPPSLLFFATFMSRIAYPLCYNFLNLSGNNNTSVFESFMGTVNLVKIFGERFNLYVPILMSIVCFATLFNLTGKVLSVFGFENYFNERNKQNDLLVSEGRVIVDQARRIEEQNMQKDDFQGEKQLFALGEATGTELSRNSIRAQKTAQLINDYKQGNRPSTVSSSESTGNSNAAPTVSWWKKPFSSKTGDQNGAAKWSKLPESDAVSEDIQLETTVASSSAGAPPTLKAARYMFDNDN